MQLGMRCHLDSQLVDMSFNEDLESFLEGIS
jgi:hypothetical protein